MRSCHLSEDDVRDIVERGLSVAEVERQLSLFGEPMRHSRLVRPCSIGDGIIQLKDHEMSDLVSLWSEANTAGRLMKFVPASGAATRMFSDLIAFLESSDHPAALYSGAGAKLLERVEYFISHLHQFAFYDDLLRHARSRGRELSGRGEHVKPHDILHLLLDPEEMNYAGLPKGLLPFHRYISDDQRTPFEEHLIEASQIATDAEDRCRVHFTLSAEHEEAVQSFLDERRHSLEERLGVRFSLLISRQTLASDTVAVTEDGCILRDDMGRIVFRPGGHGALLANLQECGGDLVLLKNIDNVAHDRLKTVVSHWKRLLTGYLVRLQRSVFSFCEELESGILSEAAMDEIASFYQHHFGKTSLLLEGRLSKSERHQRLLTYLHRPIRVCGMVKNISAPGGGPFWVEDRFATQSVQIVEMAQIDPDSEDQQAILAASTHFNPVDIVCGLRDHHDESFDLQEFIDPESYFLTDKSFKGKKIRAMERPGLWNGSMAFWNTVFVEVPLITFHPVKTVFDLLKREHML